MSILLDTHAARWFFLNDPRLSVPARNAIQSEPAQAFVSPASYWEIAIKVCLRNYVLATPFEDFWQRLLDDNGFAVLPVEIQHAGKLVGLPFVLKDPFDRMLVAQALAENLPLVSNDTRLDGYNIQRIW